MLFLLFRDNWLIPFNSCIDSTNLYFSCRTRNTYMNTNWQQKQKQENAQSNSFRVLHTFSCFSLIRSLCLISTKRYNFLFHLFLKAFNALKTKVNKLDKKIPDATTSIHINQYNTYKQNLKKKYGNCIFLSCHVRVSIELPECQETPCSKQGDIWSLSDCNGIWTYNYFYL